MGKPKDAKIWNEDLVKALDARQQQSQRDGKRDVHSWRIGRDKILAVRKDIYQFRTGTIVNLPNNLTKRVHRLCEDVVRGVKNVYPDGHVPTNHEQRASIGTVEAIGKNRSRFPATPLSRVASAKNITSSNTDTSNNPFHNDHYMKNIKIGSGAFAILMAFRYSVTEILTKRDICREAQKFSDSQMEANWHAGRAHGSWKGIDTLKNKNLVKEQGYANYTPNGFRDRPHTYSLTRDGEMFIEALLVYRPEAADTARKAAGGDPRILPSSLGGVNGTMIGTPSRLHHCSPGSYLTPIGLSSNIDVNKSANMEADRAELEEWIATASVGDRKEFKVGKQRRFRLHNLCDALQLQQPGLLLTHGSLGTSRARTMSIQIVSKSSSPSMTARVTIPLSKSASSRKRPHSPTWFDSENIPETAHSSLNYSESGVTAREKAGLAAVKRQIEAMEEIQLKTAILESKKMSATPQSHDYNYESQRRKQQQKEQEVLQTPNYGDEGEKELKVAIQASLQDQKKPAAVKRDIFAIEDSSSSDDELPGPIFSPSPIRKKRKTSCFPLKDNPREICCIDSDSDKDEELLPQILVAVSSQGATRRMKNTAKKTTRKARAIMSEKFSKDVTTPNSINLCESSDDENTNTIESLEEPIDLSNSQPSQHPDFIRESLKETIDLSNSQLSQDPDCIDEKNNDGGVDDDEIVILEDASPKESKLTTTSTAQISSPNRRCPKENNDDSMLTVWIDNRERNRNATPRMLRNELARHLSTGSLSYVWPQTLPAATVEEAKLEWGDIQYSVQSGINNPNQSPKRKLGVSIERKRVNDLVQRSSGGDHLVQLFNMKQHCSLSLLLIENDTQTARNVTPYNAQGNEGFDPFDPTIRCEDDVYRMFGRIILTCDSVKFLQTRDEQASLRSIGALGLMAVFAPSKCTKELEDSLALGKIYNINSTQALSDQLKKAGIPWRLAKRVANVVGGHVELKALYDSCCNETAKSQLLSHIICTGEDHDQGDLRSSSTGWSDAIYRVVAASSQSRSSDETKLSGEAALLLHKKLIEDHGFYLSTLYQGYSPEETLEKVLGSRSSSSPTHEGLSPRYVTISLSSEQATNYFSRGTHDDRTFYKLSVVSDDQSRSQSGAITMRTVHRSLSSKTLLVFELEGSDIVDLVRDNWITKNGNNFIFLAKTVARLLDKICYDQSRGRSSDTKRILLVCGLQPSLDSNSKKSGYATETRTVIDMVFAELLLCYDVTILQALRKRSDDRVNLMKQLALACFYCGFLSQNCN